MSAAKQAAAAANQAPAAITLIEAITQALAWELDHAEAQLSEVLRGNMARGRAVTPEELDAGRAAFAAARAAIADVIAPFDAILTPSAPGEAPEGLGWTGDPAFNSLWTLLHLPCVTVPVATGPRGLPLGVQVVTAVGRDREALAWAEWARAVATSSTGASCSIPMPRLSARTMRKARK